MSDDHRKLLHRAQVALKAMQKATDEWAAEFTQKKRAMNWAVVNDAYCQCEDVIKEIERVKREW